MKEFDSERNLELSKTPKLHKMGKRPFYKTPIGYFESFYQRLLQRIEADKKSEEDLMEEAPILSSIKKEPFFEAPEDYFSNFEFSHKFVEADVQAPQKAEGKIRSLRFVPYGLAIAAAVILLFGLLWFLPQNSTNWDEIETEELLAMAEEEKIDEYTLAKILGEEGLDEINFYDEDFEFELTKEELSKIIEEEYDLYELEEALIFE